MKKTTLVNTDPKQLLAVKFVCFLYLKKMFSIQGNFKIYKHFSELNYLDV